MIINMKFIPQYLLIGFIIFTIFYWFQIRPSEIRKECLNDLSETAKSSNGLSKTSMNDIYRMCLVKNGLKPENLVDSTP